MIIILCLCTRITFHIILDCRAHARVQLECSICRPQHRCAAKSFCSLVSLRWPTRFVAIMMYTHTQHIFYEFDDNKHGYNDSIRLSKRHVFGCCLSYTSTITHILLCLSRRMITVYTVVSGA